MTLPKKGSSPVAAMALFVLKYTVEGDIVTPGMLLYKSFPTNVGFPDFYIPIRTGANAVLSRETALV